MRLPALTSPGTGLTNTEPQFCPPGWCSRRQRTISAIVASAVRAIAGRADASRAPTHDLVVAEVGAPEAQPERRRRRRVDGAGSGAARSTTSTSTRQAAMSEPWPPAFIRTAPPIEPGTPTAHSNPVSPAAAVRRASTGSATPPPAVHDGGSPRSGRTVRQIDVAAELGDGDGDAGEARVGDEQVRAAPDDEHRQPRRRDGPRPRRPGRRASRARTNSAAGPPTRYVVSGASGCDRVRDRRRGSRRRRRPPSRGPSGERRVVVPVTTTAGAPGGPSTSSGSVAMSPQPIEMHTSPAADLAGEERDHVVAAGQPHDARQRVGVEHGVDDELAR